MRGLPSGIEERLEKLALRFQSLPISTYYVNGNRKHDKHHNAQKNQNRPCQRIFENTFNKPVTYEDWQHAGEEEMRTVESHPGI